MGIEELSRAVGFAIGTLLRAATGCLARRGIIGDERFGQGGYDIVGGQLFQRLVDIAQGKT